MKPLAESRVLIVDDVKANVDVLVQALRDDYRISVALDGPSALRSIAKNPPDLVLLDILMPGMDGYAVCRELRRTPETRELPIMFLSALDDVKDKAMGFELGANDYLTKPFELLEVKARVRSLLKAKAYSDALKEARLRELRIAHDIQMGLLPTAPQIAALAEGSGLDVCAFLEPAEEVGGDLYDVLRKDGEHLSVVVGDVAEKGIGSALFMTRTMTLLRTMMRQLTMPEDILVRVNAELTLQNPEMMFVSLVCAVFTIPERRVTYASMGHLPPVLIRPGHVPELIPTSQATVAGVLPELAVDHHQLVLAPGDALIFYTDGVTEALDAAGELYGSARLLEQLAGVASDASARELLERVLAGVRAHTGKAPVSDDLTAVVVRVL